MRALEQSLRVVRLFAGVLPPLLLNLSQSKL
jgi:hypothetical protein